mgnify:CR=1 FL=1
MRSANTQGAFNLLIARFFKKIFAAFGPKIFEHSIELIEGFAQDINSKEKQVRKSSNRFELNFDFLERASSCIIYQDLSVDLAFGTKNLEMTYKLM